ncbi:hypothetical protein PanWU01x14_165420 [Parasponia andersonii]|uniref:Uncharacterized protein n=1 Tax=Parasponia andersonii TaxID=3476 RepID=A0A2P5CBV3_PARAD|nr:hypothetical protein PanWU01x14_165420 [Parasponia andersonii]
MTLSQPAKNKASLCKLLLTGISVGVTPRLGDRSKDTFSLGCHENDRIYLDCHPNKDAQNSGGPMFTLICWLDQYGRTLVEVQVRIMDMQLRQLTQAQYQADFNNSFGYMFQKMALYLDQDYFGVPLFPQYPLRLLQPYNLFLPLPTLGNDDITDR